MSSKRLSEIQTRWEYATIGPFYVGVHSANSVYLDKALTELHLKVGRCAHWDKQSPLDAKFYAETHVDIGWLLDRLDKTKDTLEYIDRWFAENLHELYNQEEVHIKVRDTRKEIWGE